MSLPLFSPLSAFASRSLASVRNALRRGKPDAGGLGQYRLIERLGRGGMGEVYLAEHRLLRRRCAVKLIRPDKAGDDAALARFELEARMTARLSHWNTVAVHDFGRSADGAAVNGPALARGPICRRRRHCGKGQ